MRRECELLEIAETERHRVGLDLHNDLSQRLMGVSYMVKALERRLANKHLPDAAETRQIHSAITEVINHNDLPHRAFEACEWQGDDLAEGLNDLAAKARQLLLISCQFASKHAQPPPSRAAAAQLYKIARECISNSFVHGKATLILMSFTRIKDSLVLMIKTNGVRFPEDGKSAGAVGLRILRSRAALIGASLEILAEGAHGTLLTCTLPLDLQPGLPDSLENPVPSLSSSNGASLTEPLPCGTDAWKMPADRSEKVGASSRD